MYERILLPTDGSEAGNPAVDEAIELAKDTGSELHVLFVVETQSYAPELMDETVEASLQTMGEEAINTIESRAADEDVDVDVVTEIRHGIPHETIIDYADETDCDVIVMGTHGRTGLDRYLLGSVTERVVRASETPVLTVRRPKGAD